MKIKPTNPYEDEFVKLYKKENKGVRRMGEQRFKLDSEVGFIDTQKCGGDTMTHFEVVVELNKLNEENEQLKTKNNAYLQDIEMFKEENTALKLETEQLKEEIKDLNDILARYEEKVLKE